MGGWPDCDNRAISVQLNLTDTGTGTDLDNKYISNYWPNFDQTLKVGFWDQQHQDNNTNNNKKQQQQQYLIDSDQTLKVGFWD